MADADEHGGGDWDDEAPTRITHPFEPGAMFGDRFRIVRELAVGGMGSVYEARDLSTEQPVALKVMKKDRAPDREALQRFKREAQILASMDHPGIVRIRDFGHAADGRPWMAMELLQGETLLQRVRREGPQDPRVLARVVAAACDALEAAHVRGVVHRDLKPDNLFLPEGGESPVKILDFGLSQIAGGAKLTRTGAILGTPRYMAPEQIKSARSADARVDVYAMGIITYEALAGASPFAASDHGQLLGAILAGRRRPLTQVRPELPAAVEEILSQALVPNPDARIPSAGALATALVRVLAHAAPASSPGHDPEAPAEAPLVSSPAATMTSVGSSDSLMEAPERSRATGGVLLALAGALVLAAAAWAVAVGLVP